jgi:hypothetical protein
MVLEKKSKRIFKVPLSSQNREKALKAFINMNQINTKLNFKILE